ncbi:hypothetical protein HDV00_000139 [Rhizophlyctis rosea]|nr:hypothetical protein HDV00_000139 [Rhizophlyctis rosea]
MQKVENVNLRTLVQNKAYAYRQLVRGKSSLQQTKSLTADERFEKLNALDARASAKNSRLVFTPREQHLKLLEDAVVASVKFLDSAFNNVAATANFDTTANRDDPRPFIDTLQHIILGLKAEGVDSDPAAKAPSGEHQKHSKAEDPPHEPGIVGEVLADVKNNADKLESGMEEKDAFVEGQKAKGAVLDTVVKVKDVDDGATDDKTNRSAPVLFPKPPGEKNAAVIIDSDNNHYVLTKANDITEFYGSYAYSSSGSDPR